MHALQTGVRQVQEGRHQALRPRGESVHLKPSAGLAVGEHRVMNN